MTSAVQYLLAEAAMHVANERLWGGNMRAYVVLGMSMPGSVERSFAGRAVFMPRWVSGGQFKTIVLNKGKCHWKWRLIRTRQQLFAILNSSSEWLFWTSFPNVAGADELEVKEADESGLDQVST